MEKVVFIDGDGQKTEFYCLEQTILGGVTYLLVTDQEEGDASAWILKEIPNEDSEQMTYQIVDDDAELEAVGEIFSQLLEDIDFM